MTILQLVSSGMNDKQWTVCWRPLQSSLLISTLSCSVNYEVAAEDITNYNGWMQDDPNYCISGYLH